MRKLVYYIGVSLDGYIAGPNAEFDFYPLSDQLAAWINARYPETVPPISGSSSASTACPIRSSTRY